MAQSFGQGFYADEVNILGQYQEKIAVVCGLSDSLIDFNYLISNSNNLWSNTVITLDAPHKMHIEKSDEMSLLIRNFAESAFTDALVSSTVPA